MIKPNFSEIYEYTAHPLRLVFMIGSIWYLSKVFANKRLNLLEIGSWCGASALTWGEALQIHNNGIGNLTCIDAWQPYIDLNINTDAPNQHMHSLLNTEEPYNIFKYNMQFLPKSVDLRILRGWSQNILPTLPEGEFDLVYIDGDHCYESVLEDIKLSAGLVADGGIICGDDLELETQNVDALIAKENPRLDKYFNKELDIVYHPGVTLAVGETFGPVSSWDGFWAMQKNGSEWDQISLDGMPARLPSNLSSKNLVGLKSLLMQHGLI